MAPPPSTRLTADERRLQILGFAREEFAATGLHGTSTEVIAQRAGVSQPYLFRLFGTKKGLFMACVERGFDHVAEVFANAAEGAQRGHELEAMALGYAQLLQDRQELLAQMQAYAACADPEIRELVRARFAALWRLVERLSGAPGDDIRAFFAKGMLMNVAAAVDLPEIAHDDEWAGAEP